jgi:site-specific recombinase XerD
LREVLLNGAGGRDSGNAAGRQHGPYLFYNPARGYRFYEVKLGLKGAVKRAWLSGITQHTLRYPLASRLTRHGADLVTVKELLGHSTVTVTMQYRVFTRRSEAAGGVDCLPVAK